MKFIILMLMFFSKIALTTFNLDFYMKSLILLIKFRFFLLLTLPFMFKLHALQIKHWLPLMRQDKILEIDYL